MSDDALPRVPNGPQLIEQSRAYAAQLYKTVGDYYLAFRREHFRDANPSLATLPPRNSAVQQTEAARLASGTLRVIPSATRNLPVLRDIFAHLQWEVDIHTLTETERLQLHNLTMSFLYGITDGIQPWFVDWMLGASYNLRVIPHADYYLAFPWHGLFYRNPNDLATFERAVATGEVAGIEQEIGRLADGLVKVLRDPMGTQPELAFTGPNAEQRRIFFNLKTAAGLALGAYLAAELVQTLVHPQHASNPPQSVLPELPAQITTHVLPEESRG